MTEVENAGGISAPSLGRGAAIGRYVVLGLVGRGAMGEVYAAYDPELDRKVAVKLLRTQAGGSDDLTAAEAKSRLLREAQAIARLSHPNVIVVHDVGSFGERVFVAMEFVDGNTVGYWLLAAKRSWKEIRRVFMAAGHGLAAAHASGLVHRDFKLENVMVGRDGQVRVMDFGLARRASSADDQKDPDLPDTISAVPLGLIPALERPIPLEVTGEFIAKDQTVTATRILSPPEGSRLSNKIVVAEREVDLDATNEIGPASRSGRDSGQRISAARSDGAHASLLTDLTQTGAIIGTPAYMAPEQFNGSPADARSDQFSFCVALYEALYGERPFAGKTVAELSDNVRKGAIVPGRDSTGVPGWLRRVVTRGLRTNPAERWASMDALLSALQKDPGVLWRRWGAVGAPAVGIAVLGIAARRQGALDNRPTCEVPSDRFARVWERDPVPGSRRAEITAAFRATGQPYAADAMARAARLLDGYVANWSAMYTDTCQATNVRGEQSAEVLDLRMSCLRDRWNEMRALSDVLVEPNAEVVTNAVKAAAALTSLDGCTDVRTLREAVPPPQNRVTQRQVEDLRAKLATVKALYDAGSVSKALAPSAELVARARTVGYPPLLAEALARLGMIESSLAKGAEAEASLDEAIWLAEGARYDEIVVTASVEQIYVAGSLQRDLPLARRWMRQAEAFLTRMGGHELWRAWMLNNIGVALDSHGDLEEAAARYRAAIAIKERVLGPSDPDLGISLSNLAGILTYLGRPDDALEQADRGVKIVAEALGWENPHTARQLATRADILNHVGRYADARVDAERAIAVWEREASPDHPDWPYFLAPLGDSYLGLEQPAKAMEPLERALTIAEHTGNSDLPSLRFLLAQALWDSNQDRQRATQLVGQVLAALEAKAADSERTLQAQDRDLQSRAMAWMKTRRSSTAMFAVGGRKARGTFRPLVR